MKRAYPGRGLRDRADTGQVVYAIADLSAALGIDRQLLNAWILRYEGWPPPEYRTPRGQMFWTETALEEWRQFAAAPYPTYE